MALKGDLGRIVLVSGGRHYSPEGALASAFLMWLEGFAPVELWHGDAEGVDRWASDCAWQRGIVPVPFPASWESLGLAAGPERNARMGAAARRKLVAGHDVRWYLFPGGPGTQNAREVAERLGIPTEPSEQGRLSW